MLHLFASGFNSLHFEQQQKECTVAVWKPRCRWSNFCLRFRGTETFDFYFVNFPQKKWGKKRCGYFWGLGTGPNDPSRAVSALTRHRCQMRKDPRQSLSRFWSKRKQLIFLGKAHPHRLAFVRNWANELLWNCMAIRPLNSGRIPKGIPIGKKHLNWPKARPHRARSRLIDCTSKFHCCGHTKRVLRCCTVLRNAQKRECRRVFGVARALCWYGAQHTTRKCWTQHEGRW